MKLESDFETSMNYTSCIRIRGVPILPPLLTEESRSEMMSYKQLALAVEEKLSRQRLTPQNSPDAIKSFSTPRVSPKSWKCGSKPEEMLSDDETTLTKSTDLNKYLINPSDTSDASSEPSKPRIPTSLDIVPITLEPLKKSKSSSSLQNSAEEPRKLVRQGSYTLETPSPLLLAHLEQSRPDYVPTNLADPQKMPSKRQWNLNEAKNIWNCQSSLKTAEKTPKSPQKMRENSEKTLSNSEKLKKRKNGSLECINTQFSKVHLGKTSKGMLDRSKSSYEVKNRYFEDKSQSCLEKQKNFVRRAQSFEKSQENCDLNVLGSQLHLQNRSFKEKCQNLNFEAKIDGNVEKNSRQNLEIAKNQKNFDEIFPENESQRNSTEIQQNLAETFAENMNNENFTTNDCQNSNVYKEMRKDETTSIVLCETIDKEISGSISNLENSTTQISTTEFDEQMTRSFDTNDFEPQKDSERLLGVFRDIQKTHDRQMADLIERQQKEQVFMQQAFEKQQLMLLEQIDKSFPGISIMDLVKKIKESDKKGRDWKNDDFSSSFDSDGSISINLGESVLEEASPDVRLHRLGVNRQLFPLEGQSQRIPIANGGFYDEKHIEAATKINAFARGFLVRRMMKTERIISLKNTYKEALHCMLKLTIDAPLELPEFNFHQRLQLQCDGASMNIVELFSQNPSKRMEIINQDRQIKKARMERPSSARSSISFATQRTRVRRKFKELGIFQVPESSEGTARARCMSWTSNSREKNAPGIVYRGIKRSTSAGAMRKPWR